MKLLLVGLMLASLLMSVRFSRRPLLGNETGDRAGALHLR